MVLYEPPVLLAPLWVSSGSTPTTLKPYGIKVRQTVKLSKQETSAADFHSLAKEIDDLALEVGTLLGEHNLWPQDVVLARGH